MQFIAQDGLGYLGQFPTKPDGEPDTETRTILSGPFQGFIGLVTPYTLTTTAHTTDGSETRLQRSVQTVSIPVFQFGVFSETDLSFFPGPNFNFGGRVHSNGHLFLAGGNTVTLSDRVTALGEVIRTKLSNSWPTQNGYQGNVRAIKAPGFFATFWSTREASWIRLAPRRTSRSGRIFRSEPTTAICATAVPAPNAWTCRSLRSGYTNRSHQETGGG